MLTPQKIQDLADPIESIYISMTNELLVNIGKHIRKPTWTHTAAWEIQKLSELGQLTQENAEIINRWIKEIPEAVRDTMEETRRQALESIEKQMEKAVQDGYLTPPMRDSTYDVLKEYSQQAADQLNLVNTTMLQSSVSQYQRLVYLTQDEYNRLLAQQEATQGILNQAAGNVASGTETRTKALQRAIQKISAEGLTGFYDKAGRSWSPEAYVNMDIRTTVHNVAIQSVKNRMEDYNTTVFQVSAHAGARPLCYPYQGKLLSWDNTEGDITLGNGETWHYKPVNSSSYGEPAGLFGINCGHSPIPMIPGVSIPHAQDYVQPKEKNDKQYQESQKQRALEREIRAAKRAVEMGDNSDDAKEKVKAAQAKMREFIKETGRTRRYDREQLYGAKKAPGPGSDNMPKQPKQPKPATPKPATPKVEPVKVADSAVSDIAEKRGVAYNAVTRHVKQPTEQEIIDVLAGGDKTKGSCASVALAYVGQKKGYNVLDFRDGDSRSTFSADSTLQKLKELPGIVWDEQHGRYGITTGNQLLKRVEVGKEYYFCACRHAAIVKKLDTGQLQYLELQSARQNGWKDFNGNARHTLSVRFGGTSSPAFLDWPAYMFEVDSLKDSPEFAKILGYINTAKDEQKKGLSGTIK